MSKELKDYTSQELYNELWDRHYGNVVLFTDEDVKRAWLDATRTFPDEDEIQDVWAHVGDTMRDRMIERGWDVLNEAVEEVLA